MAGFSVGCGVNDDYVRFVTVQLKIVCLHPRFNFCETVAEGGVGGVGDGLGGDVQLDIVGVTVKMESMLTDDMAKGEDVEDEEEGTKHRPLGDTL